ncbi:MAG: RtcB family protein [Candidatus Symbiothrix sp.]|jgi:tRNA-splicing ligase RtcB|nr:RtcB family protein [Candidatus Symbiothrix sp.]
MGLQIQPKILSKIGYTNNVSRSLAINIISKHCKHDTKENVIQTLEQILETPQTFLNDEVWGKLANHFCPQGETKAFSVYELKEKALAFKTYGGKYIESVAKQQMELAMRLPVSLAGALMADAHTGYGLPIGGVLAVDNAVIPYAVGVDIGCRMTLSVLDEKPAFLSRYAFQLKEALKANTHFGMEGGIPFEQEHEVLERPEFRTDAFLKNLHGKAVRQLGSSGGGNHFVEWGELELFEKNVFDLPAGKYTALLSHSGSRGLGTEIARHYSAIAREQCRLPREAGHFAWLNMDSEAGQAYWMSMNLAGDYAQACHERIHINLTKALGLKIRTTVGNHHNFAWKETLNDGKEAIVHRKGATPAHTGEPGIVPGSMTTPGYLVVGKGNVQSLHSASHGAGRAMSRQKAKENFTQSALKKMLSAAGVQLIGGSVEEAPLAYKDIERVMDFQQELVDIHGKFMPRIVRMNKE